MSNKKNDYNLVGHCWQDGSDKVYMACIREAAVSGINNPDSAARMTYMVIGKWGRRGKTLKSQEYFRSTDYSNAKREQEKLFYSKIKKGYEDIDQSVYDGSVTRDTVGIKEALEMGGDFDKDDKTLLVNILKEPETSIFGDTAICSNNIGMEDKFDEGIEYVCEKHPDWQMLFVYDKNGVKGEFFKDRFAVCYGAVPPFQFAPMKADDTIRFMTL